MRRHATTLFRIGLLALVVVMLVTATGCEYAADFDPAAFPWVTWVVGLVNFAIFAWIIIHFGGPYIQDFYADRKEEFVQEMEAAKEARKQAEARLEEYNQKLEELEQERQALLDEYHAQGEREKKRIVEEAKQQVEKMRTDAEATIDQEVKKAKAMLERQAVDLAVDMARDKAHEKLDESTHEELFDRYVSELDDSEAA